MQVIMKADGMPTYHLANVVDDHLMKVTHVARGEEWLSSVPKHLLLYEYFQWQPPLWYHLPLMRNPDRTKLSKRRNPTSLSYFAGLGYLPACLVNFLGLFFVTTVDGEEMMDFAQLAERFDPSSLAKSGAVFDMTKLGWLNGRWIREKLSPEGFREAVIGWATQDRRFEQALELARTRISVLSDLPGLAGFVFAGGVSLKRADFEATRTSADQCLDYQSRSAHRGQLAGVERRGDSGRAPTHSRRDGTETSGGSRAALPRNGGERTIVAAFREHGGFGALDRSPTPRASSCRSQVRPPLQKAGAK